MAQKTSIHAVAGMHRKLVLFATQLEGYLAHFPNCHKYTLTQSIRQAFLDVYNLVTECQKRYFKKTSLTQLDVRHEQLRMMIHLANELGLEISHYSLHPVKRGANFCGFRTWARGRFVRPHVIRAMRTDARRNRMEGVVSRLGHARRTCSFKPLLSYLKEKHHDLYLRLPKVFHTSHHHSNGAARQPGAGRQPALHGVVHA